MDRAPTASLANLALRRANSPATNLLWFLGGTSFGVALRFGAGGRGLMDTRIATFAAFLTYGVVLTWVMLTLFHPAMW
jgi:hypothetical protein